VVNNCNYLGPVSQCRDKVLVCPSEKVNIMVNGLTKPIYFLNAIFILGTKSS